MPAIALDLGGVLLTDGSVSAWRTLDVRFGIPAAASSELWFRAFRARLALGEASETELWAALAALAPAVPPPPRAIRETFLSGYREIPHGVTLLQRAHGAGWRTVLATNNRAPWLDFWRSRFPWFGLLDAICSPAESGARKPADTFFARLRSLVVEPEAYFVDDKAANVAAAERHGFGGIFATPGGSWDELPVAHGRAASTSA